MGKPRVHYVRDQGNLPRNWLQFWIQKLLPAGNSDSQMPALCPLEQEGLWKEGCSLEGADVARSQPVVGRLGQAV